MTASAATPMSGTSGEDSCPEAPTSAAAEREAKKRRLRQLREDFACVRTIMNHMAKYYSSIEPPPWLDLRIVAGQLMRSTGKNARHAAWRHLRETLASVHAWMGDHGSWKEAVQICKMPYLGTPSEIKAVEFIYGKQPCLPKCLMQSLRQARLEFLLDNPPRPDNQLPEFWRGAALTDPVWRSVYMEKHTYNNHLPFGDDLNDLVLTLVCREGRPAPDNDQHQSLENHDVAEGEGEEDASEPGGADSSGPQSPVCDSTERGRARSEDGGGNDAGSEPASGNLPKPDGANGRDGPGSDTWEHEVHATMSRIAETVNEALATEKERLLGKRSQHGDETVSQESAVPRQKRKAEKPGRGAAAQGHNHAHADKRQKTAEHVAHSHETTGSIEDGIEDDCSPPSTRAPTSKQQQQYKRLKAGYKSLSTRHKELADAFGKLEGCNKELAVACGRLEQENRRLDECIEQMAIQHKELRRQHNAGEQAKKQLEEKQQQLSAECAALAEGVKRLEERGCGAAAQTTALENENKILKAQMVSLMAKVEALEQAQAQAARDPVAEAPRAAGSDAAAAEQASERQSHSAVGLTHHGSSHGAGSLAQPSRVKDDGCVCLPSSSSSSSEMGAPRHCSRDLSWPRQPWQQEHRVSPASRVLHMPTFDRGYTSRTDSHNRILGYAYPSRLTSYANAGGSQDGRSAAAWPLVDLVDDKKGSSPEGSRD